MAARGALVGLLARSAVRGGRMVRYSDAVDAWCGYSDLKRLGDERVRFLLDALALIHDGGLFCAVALASRCTCAAVVTVCAVLTVRGCVASLLVLR